MKESRELVKREPKIWELEEYVEAPVPPHNAGYGVENIADDEMHLRDYWRLVRKHLWLIIGIAVLMTTLAAIYMAHQPDVYRAQSRVQVDLENTNRLTSAAKNGSVILSNSVNDPAYFNTQLQILTGPGLLRRVVKTLDLEHNQGFLHPQSVQNRSTWQSLQRMVGLNGRDQDNARERAGEEVPLTVSVAPATAREDLVEAKQLAPYVKALQKNLEVEPVKETRLVIKDTRLIDIRYSHPDPQVAAKVVNAIADAFVLSNFERKNEANVTAGDFLQRRIAELQSQIRNSEERLINYAKTHQILSLDAGQNMVVERLAGLNRQLLEAENERKLAEATYRASLAPGAADAMAESTAKQISDAESKLAELRQQRAQLLVENTEEWPEVKEINQQIAVLEKQIQDTRQRATSTIVTNLETQYRQSLARETALRAAFNQQRGETLTQNEAAINYRIIQQETETNKSLLDGLLQRSKENDVVLAGTPNNIYVIDYAITPEEPVGPKRVEGIGLAFILSLSLGVGLALFLGYLDNTMRSSDDVEKMLHLPALAIIPSVGSLTRRRLLSSVNALQLRKRDGHGFSVLLINADPRSPLAEAYRQLRTSLLLSAAGRAPKTLLVTSSQPAEGKTTTSVNTAISLAQTGAKVLLIDADMRRPCAHSIFELDNRQGLSTILSSEPSEAEVLAQVRQHEASGLYLLPSGPVPPNPAELLGSEQMRRLISTLEATFTHIVIDSPPIGSFTDGVLISTSVDGVLLVVHSGKSSREIVRHSQKLLQGVGAKIFGVVLNSVNLSAHDYYYHQNYYRPSS